MSELKINNKNNKEKKDNDNFMSKLKNSYAIWIVLLIILLIIIVYLNKKY